jgi:hypothetical protein
MRSCNGEAWTYDPSQETIDNCAAGYAINGDAATVGKNPGSATWQAEDLYKGTIHRTWFHVARFGDYLCVTGSYKHEPNTTPHHMPFD